MLSDHGKLNWGSWQDSGSMISQKKKKRYRNILALICWIVDLKVEDNQSMHVPHDLMEYEE